MFFQVFTAFLLWLGLIFTGPVLEFFSHELVSAVWPSLGQYATASSISTLDGLTAFFPVGYWVVGTVLIVVGTVVSIATEG